MSIPAWKAPGSSGIGLHLAMLLIGGVLLGTVLGVVFLTAADPGPAMTRNTIRLSLAWYTAAILLMRHLTRLDWRAATRAGIVARWCWSWAWLVFVIHVAMALHFYDHWSHTRAFERTRVESGVGEGIYFSYLFFAVWTLDVLWWWRSPFSYADRPRWIDVCLHGYLFLLIFNGTVVFETGWIRGAGILMTVLFAATWVPHLRRGIRENHEIS